MSVKKNIIMSMAVGLLGVALVSGGTVAYFSDSVETENKILSGILDLDISDEEGVLFEFTNKKPGDIFDYSFDMINAGTLDMKEITLHSDYTILNRNGKEVSNGFDEQIKVNHLEVDGEPIIDKAITLKELKENSIVLAQNINVNDPAIEVYVAFEFIRTDNKQDEFQGNTLDLHWTFEAMQEDD